MAPETDDRRDRKDFSPAPVITALHTANFVPALLNAVNAVVPFNGALLTRIYLDRRPGHVYDTVRAERRQLVVDQYLDTAYLLDLIYNAFVQGLGDSVLRLRDVAPDHFRRSTYFKHYYGNIDLADELAVLVRLPDRSALFMSLGRLGGEPRFLSREVTALRRELEVIAALVRKHFDRPAPPPPPQPDVTTSITEALDTFGEGVLTAREQEIATLILRGHSTASISEVTGTAVGTVKIHRKNLYRKLRISSQSELLARFLGAVMA